ncbi:MAG: hypothetical protein K0V04_15760 [Deltaproteobacteria bacterium]|nr:hypothetical protein [Deltaproteobacteria bacterium]
MTDSDDLGRVLREQIDARLEQAATTPDADDMFRRAAQLGRAGSASLDDREALRPFVDAYRTRLDALVQTIEAGGPPAVARRGPVLPWVLAAAAAAAMVVGGMTWLGSWRSTADQSGVGAGHSAQHGANPQRPVAEVRHGTPLRPRATAPVERTSPPAPIEAEAPAVQEIEPAPAVVDTPPSQSAPSLRERLRALDVAAQAAWRRGELAKAERGYRMIVKLGGRREVAELAYGELFAIVRQRGGKLQALWRAYLRRFPTGRYAEDVTAGLCRRGPSADADACWERYRRRFPNGIHAP